MGGLSDLHRADLVTLAERMHRVADTAWDKADVATRLEGALELQRIGDELVRLSRHLRESIHNNTAHQDDGKMWDDLLGSISKK